MCTVFISDDTAFITFHTKAKSAPNSSATLPNCFRMKNELPLSQKSKSNYLKMGSSTHSKKEKKKAYYFPKLKVKQFRPQYPAALIKGT